MWPEHNRPALPGNGRCCCCQAQHLAGYAPTSSVRIPHSLPMPCCFLNPFQATFYFLWGLALTSWTFYFSALWREARPAVLLAVIWLIISGWAAWRCGVVWCGVLWVDGK